MAQDAMRRRAAAAAATLLLAASGGSAGPPPPEEGGAEGSPYVETVEVRLVLLHATVLNRRGETVGGLSPGDFTLTEDGVAQEISVFGTSSDQPVEIAFLLDVSGSMAIGGKIDQARRAIGRFVESLEPRDRFALLSFADGGVVVEHPFTGDRAAFFGALKRLQPYGRTALRDALAHAPSLLAEAEPGRKALVLVTDGLDNASRMTTWEAVRTARRVRVPVFAIGLRNLPASSSVDRPSPHGGRSLFEMLRDFTDETGGALIPAFGPEEISGAVDLVRERLRGQYVIGYRPRGTGDAEGFRRIILRTRRGGHRILTRSGYYVRR